MPIIEDLTNRQIDDCLGQAVRKDVPVTLTCRLDASWWNLRTRILAREGEDLRLAEPTGNGAATMDIPPGTLLGLSFKLRHHKHVFTAAVTGACAPTAPDGRCERQLRVGAPARMQRIQRRAFLRVTVPSSRSVLATFWQGGMFGTEGGGGSVAWEGWVTDVSAGGFQVRLASQSAPQMDTDDVVGIRLDLGQEYPPVLSDAQFRHRTEDARGIVLLGFQFVGLSDSPRGRKNLRTLVRAVSEFSHCVRRPSERGVA